MNRRGFLATIVGCIVAASMNCRLEKSKELITKSRFGFLSTTTNSEYYAQNIRREVFYRYSAGPSPLCSLVNLLKEND